MTKTMGYLPGPNNLRTALAEEREDTACLARTSQVRRTKRGLNTVKSLTIRGRRSQDLGEWVHAVKGHFEKTWVCNLLEKSRLLQGILEAKAGRFAFTSHEVMMTREMIKESAAFDAHGTSSKARRMVTFMHADKVGRGTSALLASNAQMGSLLVQGTVKGKVSAHAKVKDLRAILPMLAILEVADKLVTDRCHRIASMR